MDEEQNKRKIAALRTLKDDVGSVESRSKEEVVKEITSEKERGLSQVKQQQTDEKSWQKDNLLLESEKRQLVDNYNKAHSTPLIPSLAVEKKLESDLEIQKEKEEKLKALNTKSKDLELQALKLKEKRDESKLVEERQSENNGNFFRFFLVFVSTIIIITGIVVLFFAISGSGNEEVVIPITTNEPKIVDYKQEVSLPFNTNTYASDIRRVFSDVNNSGDITKLSLMVDGQEVGFGQLVNALNFNTPSELVGFVRDRFFLGMYTDGLTNDLVIVLPVSSFSSAYSGIVTWENDIYNDLSSSFPIGEYTPKASVPSLSPFVPSIVNNASARVIEDVDNEKIIIWSFVGRDYLVITTGINAFMEVQEGLLRN